MIKELEVKLEKEQGSYSDAEVAWLLDHIGDFESDIRDDVVYESFALGITKGLLTKDQYQFLVEEIIQRELLFFKLSEGLPTTVTRSFTALLCALLIKADGQEDSTYFQLMTDTQRDYFFRSASEYLDKETDFIGVSDTYGWVHGFAHGGDFLKNCLLHPEFPAKAIPSALQSIEAVFHRLPEAFITGEERRLAMAVYQPILQERMPQETLTTWLTACKFPEENLLERMRLACFENFLAAIYFHLVEQIELSAELEESLMVYLRHY